MSKEKRVEAMSDAKTGIRLAGALRMPYGWACAVFSEGVLVSVEWEPTRERLADLLRAGYPGAGEIAGGETEAVSFLERYANGEIIRVREVSALPIGWDTVGSFDRKVLRETARIPYGETETYGGLAARIGHPSAVRAVGGALGRNPWPLIVPCHRVIGAGNRLVGFGKGLEAKRILLGFEKTNAAKRVA